MYMYVTPVFICGGGGGVGLEYVNLVCVVHTVPYRRKG